MRFSVLYGPMCARFVTPVQAAAERYWKTIAPLWQFSANWRVLPMQQIPIVLAIDGVTTGLRHTLT